MTSRSPNSWYSHLKYGQIVPPLSPLSLHKDVNNRFQWRHNSSILWISRSGSSTCLLMYSLFLWVWIILYASGFNHWFEIRKFWLRCCMHISDIDLSVIVSYSVEHLGFLKIKFFSLLPYLCAIDGEWWCYMDLISIDIYSGFNGFVCRAFRVVINP